MNNSDQIIARLETQTGAPISDEDRAQLEAWESGRHLATIIDTPGWDVVKEMITARMVAATRELLKTSPERKDYVLANHAVAFAIDEFANGLIQDIQRCVDESKQTPEILKAGIRNVASGPLDLMQ